MIVRRSEIHGARFHWHLVLRLFYLQGALGGEKLG
jgi:hypothetical protein